MNKHSIWDVVRLLRVYKQNRSKNIVKFYIDAAMKLLLPLLIITVAYHLSSAAPSNIQEYELSMLNKLNKPWMTPDKPPQYPRKGEYPCKGGICKVKAVETCEDCQHAKPLWP
nr:uncharacterized protein LOC126055668 [Helicoverpa armigera]